jgi:hypothetical protein
MLFLYHDSAPFVSLVARRNNCVTLYNPLEVNQREESMATRKRKTARKTSSSANSARKSSTTARRKRARATSTDNGGATPKSSGAATLLYIHGIGNKPPASVLKGQWDQALFEFDLGERSRMAYWVDRERYPVPLEAVSSGGDYADATEEAPHSEFSAKAMRAPWSPELELEDIEDDIVDLVGSGEESLATTTEAERLFGIAAKMLGEGSLADDSAYEQIAGQLQGAAGAEARRIQAQRYGAAAVRAKIFGFLPRPLRQCMTRRRTKLFLRYLNDLCVDKVKGDRMRQSLRERLQAKGGPFIVIAHSQGTMIAYTVLLEPEFAEFDIPLFVTIGSPLGVDEVQDMLSDLSKSL